MTLTKGDTVRLTQPVTEHTDRGVRRSYPQDHQFTVVSARGSEVEVRDATGCRLVLPLAVLARVEGVAAELVAAADAAEERGGKAEQPHEGE